MTEHVLNYTSVEDIQDNYYWCGPTSTHMVLSTGGVALSQAQCAAELGTTTDGTAYVGLVEQVLNNHLPNAHYASVYPPDPPSPADKEALWANIVNSINVGLGCVINICVPPSNYPIGVKGSQTPAYGGGTVYHYIAAMGFDDNPAQRAVLIADPGFRPFSYWVSLDQLVTMIPPKGYTYSTAQPQFDWEAFMATNQEKLDAIFDKLAAYPGVPGIGGKWPSRAIFKSDNNGIDDTVGMVLNTDGTVWDILVVLGAQLGAQPYVDLVNQLAAGKGPNGGVPQFVAFAKAIQAKIPKA